MTQWTIVLWSAARQIAKEADLPAELWPEDEVVPEAFFQTLRESEDPSPALSYAASALPKLEAVEWALASLPPVAEDDRDFAQKRLLRDAARRWIDEPDDENRRAVFDLAEKSNNEWPETLIGLAIFFSGGSIAPEDNPPVSVDPSIGAKLISGALQSATAAHAKSDPALSQRALDLANDCAVRGREALAAT